MELKFAVRMAYDENLFYHRIAASKPRTAAEGESGNSRLSIGPSDIGTAAAIFLAFFLAFSEVRLTERALLSAALAVLAMFILRRSYGKWERAKNSGGKEAQDDRDQAKVLLKSSELAGRGCTVIFGEDSFFVETPGIITEYKYEGIARIRETPEYYMIFWNRSTVIPVEKAGFYRGKQEQFGAFLEKKCGKAIEKVPAA